MPPYGGGQFNQGDSKMAEIAKKAKAPAKPKVAGEAKAPTKTKAAKAKAETAMDAGQVKAITPSHHEIAQLAERYWAERGWQDGYAEQDWLRAEQELIGIAS
jgi:Protein of unknown function (DUF2934)